MKIGILGYTNLKSGVGVFTWELYHYLNADSILSVGASIKGQEQWIERQYTANALRPEDTRAYFDEYKPDVLIFTETPFQPQLYQIAREYGVKLVSLVMHESFGAKDLRANLQVCPCDEAYRKARSPKALMFLPIGLKLFPFTLRTGHVFNASIGYSGVHDRRQVGKVVTAFQQLKDKNARLIINTQCGLPDGVTVRDNRITVNHKSYDKPHEIYDAGDISILPISHGGYERGIPESMACGLPCLTMDAEPMNLNQHDANFLIPADRTWELNDKWVRDTIYHEVSVETLRKKMEWLLTIDTPKYSRWARAQAEAQSWESKDIDYLGAWKDMLENL